MALTSYTADELFSWVTGDADFLLVDVRNNEEFGRFKVEGPRQLNMINVPYMEFIEHEDESVARVPKGKPIRIVCAKEGSAKFVGEILDARGYGDVRYLQGGIKSWGNLLAPIRLHADGYELHQFRRPGKASCSYGLVHGDQLFLFDPSRNLAFYQQFANERGLRISKTFETHKQADYISGGPELARVVGSEMHGSPIDFAGASFRYTAVNDGDTFAFDAGGPTIRALHTPGHTPGSTCYLIDGRHLVSGDTVFIRSVGRPDLGGQAEAWSKYLFKTMSTIIKNFDPATLVLPAHYVEWEEANADLAFVDTLANIIARNKDIYDVDNEADFFAFIKANIRPQPPEYVTIREINAGQRQADDEEQEVLDLGKNECAASAHMAAGK